MVKSGAMGAHTSTLVSAPTVDWRDGAGLDAEGRDDGADWRDNGADLYAGWRDDGRLAWTSVLVGATTVDWRNGRTNLDASRRTDGGLARWRGP